MLFTGHSFCRLDNKNRLVIPGRIRDLVNVQEQGSGWFLVPGYDNTITVYTPKVFEELANNERVEMFRLSNVRNYTRLHFALSHHVEMDRLGRVLIPEWLLQRTSIGADLAVLGVKNHLEIWSRKTWEKFVDENFGEYDEMARSAYETEQGGGKPSS